MIIEKRIIGFDGEYSWYIDGKVSRLSEREITKLVSEEKEKEFFDLWKNCVYCGFKIEV